MDRSTSYHKDKKNFDGHPSKYWLNLMLLNFSDVTLHLYQILFGFFFSYRAALVSKLSVQSLVPPFNTLDGLVETGYS